MSNVLAVREEIAKTYDRVLDNVHVSTHGGPIRIEDITEIADRSPAIIVTCLGIPRIFKQGTVTAAEVVFGIFCLTESSKKGSRDALALALVESVMSELFANRWGGFACGAPKDEIATNLYSTDLDRCGVSLWAVRWRQQVDLERNSVALIDDFDTLFNTYVIGPTDTPVTEDLVDLT